MKKLLLFISACAVLISTATAQNLKPKKDKATKKYGYADSSDRWVIEPVYDDADRFRNGVAEVKIGKKRGLVAEDGRVLFEPRFDDIGTFRDGIAIVESAKKKGFISIDGRMLCEPRYDAISRFYDGEAVITAGRRDGLILSDGTVVIEPRYDNISTPLSDLNQVRQGYGYGIIDRAGREVFEPIYAQPLYFNRYGISPACIRRGDVEMHGLLSAEGCEIVPVECLFLAEVAGRYIVQRSIDKWYIYDAAAQMSAGPFEDMAPLKSDSGDQFISPKGLVAVRAGMMWGFVNVRGELVVPFRYDAVGFGGFGFNRGLCSVCVGGLWGYIDENGQWFAPAVFSEAGPFMKTQENAIAAKVRIGRRNEYMLYAEGCRLIPIVNGQLTGSADPVTEYFSDGKPRHGTEGARQPSTGGTTSKPR